MMHLGFREHAISTHEKLAVVNVADDCLISKSLLNKERNVLAVDSSELKNHFRERSSFC